MKFQKCYATNITNEVQVSGREHDRPMLQYKLGYLNK